MVGGLLRTEKSMASENGEGRFSAVLDEFEDIFKPTGLPRKRDITHCIDLVDKEARPLQ